MQLKEAEATEGAEGSEVKAALEGDEKTTDDKKGKEEPKKDEKASSEKK